MPEAGHGANDAATLRAPYVVVDDFLPIEVAAAMRSDIDAHFAEPGRHRPDSHQIWNYWFVPELYTYLRTLPQKVIRHGLVDQFNDALRLWSSQVLGMKEVSNPNLSLYISGCRQNMHNDAKNGRFAFVYSLTRNERKSVGGRTIVLHEGDPFRANLTNAAAGRNFYTAIEPRFNRLVIFDDRIPHGVEMVEGPMDPCEGRFVLHGHIRDGGPVVEGALPAGIVNRLFVNAMTVFFAKPYPGVNLRHGPLVLRLTVGRAGEVESCHILVDRAVSSSHDGDVEWRTFVDALVRMLGALKFPPADGITTLIQPLLFGGQIK